MATRCRRDPWRARGALASDARPQPDRGLSQSPEEWQRPRQGLERVTPPALMQTRRAGGDAEQKIASQTW